MKFLAPKPLLHLEGLGVLILATLAYRHLHGSWGLFALLFLAPDAFMAGYLIGPRAGALIYNLGHTYLAPLAAIAVAVLAPLPWLVPIGLIWTAHIGFDRALGYGLKYEDAFTSTHLGRV